MKRIVLALVSMVFLTTHSFADDVELAGKMDGEKSPGKFFHGGWCRLDLSDEQRAKMRSEKFKFEESKIDLVAQLKHARLAYRQVLSDPKSDYGAAKSATKEIANAVSKLATAKALFKAEISFKVFTPEQRKEAVKCHMGGHGFSGHPSGRAEQDDTDAPKEEVVMLDENDDE